MSKEGACGGEEQKETCIKDLEAKLRQYEKELQDARNELKLKEEKCEKSEESNTPPLKHGPNSCFYILL